MMVYKNIDVHVLIKLTIQKSISSITTVGFNAIRKDIYKRLVSILYIYRERNKSVSSELVLPEAIKYYPLYLSSLLKKPVDFL